MDYQLDTKDWDQIYFNIQSIPGLKTSNEDKARRFIEAIYHISQGGYCWRSLPQDYGHWRAVHKRYKSWKDNGIWKKIFPDPQPSWLSSRLIQQKPSVNL